MVEKNVKNPVFIFVWLRLQPRVFGAYQLWITCCFLCYTCWALLLKRTSVYLCSDRWRHDLMNDLTWFKWWWITITNKSVRVISVNVYLRYYKLVTLCLMYIWFFSVWMEMHDMNLYNALNGYGNILCFACFCSLIVNDNEWRKNRILWGSYKIGDSIHQFKLIS